MNIRILLTGLLLLVSATTAVAAGPYVGASGGVSIFHDQDIKYSTGRTNTAELKTGYGFNVNAGYNFDPVRVEFEFGYKKADVDKFTSGTSGSGSDTAIMSYMADVYYDIKNSSKFTPFIGVGLGALNGEFNSPGFNSDDTVFGYQFIVGAAYSVTQNVALDLSYRLQGAVTDFNISGSDVSYISSNIVAGLRYNF
jgi:outer membrane immunogenic protein